MGLAVFNLLIVPAPLFTVGYSMLLEASDGRLLSAAIANDGQWRFPPDAAVPPRFKAALLTYEDRRFESHAGVDWLAVGRALVGNARSGTVQSGASTITMQLVRIWRGNPARTIGEKLVEVFCATKIELTYTKEAILQLYAAHAPFGGNVVGLEAAAWRYFGRSPSQLSWAEAATLAVLPNSPGLINVAKNRAVLQQKRDGLLQTMTDRGLLDADALAAARLEPLPNEPLPLPRVAPHLAQTIKLKQRAAGEVLNPRVHSTIDFDLQERLNGIVERHGRRLAGNGILNMGVLVLRLKDHSIAAYVGNTPPREGGRPEDFGADNDLVQAKRSTGSVLKPFLYAAMLDSGELLPSQLELDLPTRFGSYAPENNTRHYEGAVPASEALARSLNVPAVRELRRFGLDRFYRLLKDLGMTTLFRSAGGYGLPLILGGAEGSLWELTNMYADLGSHAESANAPFGSWSLAPGYLEASGGAGLSHYPIDRGAAYLTLKALLEVGRPDEEAQWENFASSAKIAWKTGTSFGFRDAWAIGLNASYVVGVWVGNADGSARPDLRGYSAAAPVLFDTFSALPRGAWFEEPTTDLTEVSVCADSGFRASPDCPNQITMKVPLKAAEARLCPYCQIIHMDPTGHFITSAALTNPLDMVNQKRFILPPYIEYYYRSVHPDYQGLPPNLPGLAADNGPPRLGIVTPEPGSALYIPVELDGSPGRAVFQAVHSRRSELLFWHIDGDYLGMTSYPHTLQVRPGFGRHVLTVLDHDGNLAESIFTILSK